ncbi:type II toxin-antitoxin system Phd/YefM family antitoxin [Pseudanabaena sp. PCC 6802]|uniref:type II toxin-antitoxin system Phd/YefM family antitoxin n=1 Tax=Pseudanabaena sp. PCC 6802 TaxID=118173 RepID=UPI0003473347|nr:type II toxin-antitoxin system Phd/YefM family antitoxin [Pseudanabaena sp. PCC 6802]
MQSFTLIDIRDRSDEVFNQAAAAPVLLTQESQPTYVLLSIYDYRQLIERLDSLEDRALGKLAELSRNQSQMVGTETFTTELTRLAALDNRNL